MAYAAGTLKFIMKGSLFGVQDWSIGIQAEIAGAVSFDYSIMQTFLNANTGPFVTFYNAVSAIRSAQCLFETLRVEQYVGTDQAFTVNEVAVTGQVPGATQAKHAATTAVALSLLTNRPGASYRGRFYLPALSADITPATGYWLDTQQTTVRNATQVLIQSINAMTVSGADLTPVVASRTLGLSRTITQVRSDNLLDVQRRRNNDFPRNYTTTSV